MKLDTESQIAAREAAAKLREGKIDLMNLDPRDVAAQRTPTYADLSGPKKER